MKSYAVIRTIKFWAALSIAFLAIGLCDASEPTADFYLSPNGNDDWSGTLAKTNENKTDGPFASLERAREAVRELKDSKSTDITVLIREGVYQLDETIVFGLEDSGNASAMITYAAYPGETPVFSSGQKITGWEKASTALTGLPAEARGKVWVADVSASGGDSSRFFTLFDSKGLLPRARSATGFIPTGSKDAFSFPKGRLQSWKNINDVEVFVRPFQAWIVNILPLKSVDEKRNKAQTSIAATYPMNALHYDLKGEVSCWVENVMEELDEPGEWVLNRNEGKVYLWPRDDEPQDILRPQLLEFIRLEGKIDKRGPKDIPVRNLCFRGLTFMHGDRYQLSANDIGLQHDWDMFDKGNALVRLRGAENCKIEQCHFQHSGSGAVRIDLHGIGNTISGNHIEHLGGGGILLCGYGPGTKDVNKNNLVYNNCIHHVGEIYWHSPGIFLWQSGENRVANNLIYNTPYTGIILSGVMTEFFARGGRRELVGTIRKHEMKNLSRRPTLNDVRPYLHTHGNTVEYNEIHHAMEKLADGNAVYIRGAGANNVIRRNYIHDLVAPTIMQAAIRTDGGQKDTLIAENLIYRCTAQGILLKLNNRCENNIIADVIGPPRGYYVVLREGPMTGATIKRNILYSTKPDCTFIHEMNPKGARSEDRRGRGIARSQDTDCDDNIYYCTADRELGKQLLKSQQQSGVDAGSLAVDPMFVDPANGDFRLKPDSPVLKLGFVPFDMSKVGLVD